MKSKYIVLSVIFIVIISFLIYTYSPLLYDREVYEEFPIVVSEEQMKVENMPIDVEENSNKMEQNNIQNNDVVVMEMDKDEEIEEEVEESETPYQFKGTFMDGEGSYESSGTVTVYNVEGGSILRFEDFSSTNGPDLKVYLATDSSAADFVSLGDLKGNIGSQNYDLSEDIDLEKYDTILIWCERFSALFGYAELS